MTATQAIMEFFNPPKVTMEEMKKLSFEERQELGKLAAESLGQTFEPGVKPAK